MSCWQTFAYDLAGNRLQQKSGGTVTYTYNALHELTQDGNIAYAYDDLGNFTSVTGAGAKTLTWNTAGKLISVGNVSYTYDDSGSGMLATRTAGGSTTKYFWEGYSLFLEKVNTTPQRVYFNHPGVMGMICRIDLGDGQLSSGDDAWFYLHDEAGNVIAVNDQDGNVQIEYEQDAWGNDLVGNFSTAVNGSPIMQQQSGKMWDAAAGMYYNAARWYDPRLGRFISPSPLAPEGEEAYAFCGNDPVNWVDMNGWERKWVWD